MASALQLLKKYQQVNVQEVAELTLINKAKDIVATQREQMSRGLASTGKPFINANTGTDEYSPSTAKKKGRKKPIDLKDKGDFQQDIFIDVRNEVFIIDSADSKTDKLLKQFGPDIFGLSYDSRVLVKAMLQKEAVIQTLQQIRNA